MIHFKQAKVFILFLFIGNSIFAQGTCTLRKGSRTGAYFLAQTGSVESFDWWEPPIKPFEGDTDDARHLFIRSALSGVLQDSSAVMNISDASLKNCILSLIKKPVNNTLNIEIVKVFAPTQDYGVSDTALIAIAGTCYLEMMTIIGTTAANHWTDSVYVRSIRTLFKKTKQPIFWIEIGQKRNIYASRDCFDSKGKIRKDPTTGKQVIEGAHITEMYWLAYVVKLSEGAQAHLMAYKIPIYFRKEVDSTVKAEMQIDVSFPNETNMNVTPRTEKVTDDQHCWLGTYSFP